ncbi:MAG: DNA-processing protein DprA [Candidatus Caccovivens sp.]
MYSNLALKLYAAVCEGIIKSNSMFWKSFSSPEKVEEIKIGVEKYEKTLKNANFDVICCFDEEFPQIKNNIKQSEKPFLFVYRGDINLLKDINKNVAVIGCLTPDEDIEKRERKIVDELIKNDITIVSGLANGCDTIAHKTCVESGGKTVAFLPTVLDSIYPYNNIELANEIVKNGGLVITEYVAKSKSRNEGIKRFIERDRLQAMFSKAVILIASFQKGEGDSGSRHAMNKAKEYGHKRYVMFNEKTDKEKSIFRLNVQFLENGSTLLTQNSIKELIKQ